MKIKTMKNQLVKLSVFVVLITGLVACSNDDSNNDDGPADGQFIATVDGNSFTADGQSAFAALFNGALNVTGIDGSGGTITISISNAATGNFNLGENNGDNAAAYTINGENAFISHGEGGSGQITITSLDEENLLVSGTFEFTGARQSFDDDGNIITETISITSGAFSNIPLETQVVGTGNGNFAAEVDGVALDPDALSAIETSLLGDTIITISATNNTTLQNIGITLPGDITVGTHDFTSLPLPGSIVAQYSPVLGGGTVPFVSIDGTITITAYDPTTGIMEGTFEFTAGDFLGQDPTTFEITSGVFSVEII